MKFNLKKIIPLIGVALLIYIIIKVNPQEIILAISQVNPYLLGGSILILILSMVTQTYKWFIIAKMQGTKVPFWQAFKINVIGNFYGFVTPSRVGNIIRADYLKEYNNGEFNKGLSNFVLDKVFDLFSLIVISAVFSFVFSSVIGINYFYFSFAVLILFSAFVLIFKSESRSKIILKIFYNHLVPEKMKGKLKDGFYNFYKDLPSKKYFIIIMFFNLINWIVLFASTYYLGLSLGINVSFFNFLAIIPIASLVAQIPITISGLGTREAVLIYFFRLFGVAQANVVAMSMVSLVIGGIIPSIIAIFLMLKINPKTDEKSMHCNAGSE